MRTIAAGLLDHLEGLEATAGARKRARRPCDQAAFSDLVDMTVANLALAVLQPPPEGCLAVRAGNLTKAATRYDHPSVGKQFALLLERLDAMGFAHFDVSRERGVVSSMAPTAKFAGIVRASGVTTADFGRHPDEEVVHLSRKLTPREDSSRKERLDYKDTATTLAMREKLKEVNSFLAGADIAFVPDGLKPVNDRDRLLTRHFFVGPDQEPRFDQGGRLFGGFWQNLPAARRHAIRIDGEPVADLDYQAMHVRLAYARLGKRPPEGDLYSLPGLEEHRKAVKLAVNALFWDTGRKRKRWPEEMGATGLPLAWNSVPRLRAAILARHPDIQPAFGSAIGATLMFTESEIMMAVLGALLGKGVVALPLHDGIMVARSRAHEAQAVMEQLAGEVAGAHLPVVEKGMPFTPILPRSLPMAC